MFQSHEYLNIIMNWINIWNIYGVQSVESKYDHLHDNLGLGIICKLHHHKYYQQYKLHSKFTLISHSHFELQKMEKDYYSQMSMTQITVLTLSQSHGVIEASDVTMRVIGQLSM